MHWLRTPPALISADIAIIGTRIMLPIWANLILRSQPFPLCGRVPISRRLSSYVRMRVWSSFATWCGPSHLIATPNLPTHGIATTRGSRIKALALRRQGSLMF